MIGGAKLQEAILSWTKQSNVLFLSVLTFVLVVLATFPDKTPVNIRDQASTFPGRLLLLLVLFMLYELCGNLPALLFAIVIALLWANKPLSKSVEGFWDGVKTTYIDKNSHKWFSERVLKENTREIVEDRVDTDAVQDNKRTNMGVLSKVESSMGKTSR
jgi:hypothetical protein